jgi:hypothetical protein
MSTKKINIFFSSSNDFGWCDRSHAKEEEEEDGRKKIRIIEIYSVAFLPASEQNRQMTSLYEELQLIFVFFNN